MYKNPKLDPTLDNKWLIKHSDRLIHYEYDQQAKKRSNVEMFPEDLADKIGRPKEYVLGIIKNAIARAKTQLGGKSVV